MPDTLLDPIGRKHPFVTGEPYVRFYAGVPLSGPRGHKIGTFCLVDTKPREFGKEDVASLLAFAALVEREINLSEIIQAQNELLDTRHRLLEKQKELDGEFADAAKYVQSMLPPPFTGDESIDWQFFPSTRLGGDGLGYRRINDDQLAFYVLDVTGHGLGSALLAVTALELLRNRNPASQIDFSCPSMVIERLNRSFQMKDHAGKFFSVWYGVYSRSKRTITYANAGHPPALLLTRANDAVRLTQDIAPAGRCLASCRIFIARKRRLSLRRTRSCFSSPMGFTNCSTRRGDAALTTNFSRPWRRKSARASRRGPRCFPGSTGRGSEVRLMTMSRYFASQPGSERPPRYSRRDFLWQLLGAGALTTAGIEPLFAGDGAAPGAFRFAFLTDLHLLQDGALRCADGIAACLAAVEKLEPPPEFILCGGDLVHSTRDLSIADGEAALDFFLHLWKENTSIPTHWTFGNHDLAGTNNISVSSTDPEYGKGLFRNRLNLPKLFYSFDCLGWHFVVLDDIALVPGGRGYFGHLFDEELAFLKADLDTHRTTPTIVTTHIPIASNLPLELLLAHGLLPTQSPPKNLVCTNGKAVVDEMAGAQYPRGAGGSSPFPGAARSPWRADHQLRRGLRQLLEGAEPRLPGRIRRGRSRRRWIGEVRLPHVWVEGLSRCQFLIARIAGAQRLDEILAHFPDGAGEFAEVGDDFVERLHEAVDLLFADDERRAESSRCRRCSRRPG